MRRNALALLAVVLWIGCVFAQPPASQPAPTPPAPRTFDPDRTEVRRVDNHWVILADGVLLRDFGPREAEAKEALQIIRKLHLTESGSVGTPPVMEYWLTNGHAPYADEAALRLVPVDLNTLRVDEADGQWRLRDDRRVFFTFGASREDAFQALDVVRGYGFTRMGTVGRFTPAMTYFLGGRAEQLRRSPPSWPVVAVQPAAAKVADGAGPLPSARPRRFDFRRVEVRQDRGEWKLVVGADVLANFGPDRQAADLAWKTVQHYRFTELVSVGRPSPSFSYFLVNGQAPHGLEFGIPAQPFRPESVLVRNLGGSWMVCDGDRPLVGFGDRRDDARALADAIRRYQFDHLCRIGNVDGYGMTFLVRSR
jgi:hypothetical protein